MIVRSEIEPDIDEIRAYWYKIHGAKIVNIQEVYNKQGLANYISDQRRKKGLATEMYNQVRNGGTIEKWRMSKDWVPKKFMKFFGKFYYKYGSRLDDLTLGELVRDWVIETKNNPNRLDCMPYIDKNKTVHWSEWYNNLMPLPGCLFFFFEV